MFFSAIVAMDAPGFNAILRRLIVRRAFGFLLPILADTHTPFPASLIAWFLS
jgi:hypothetical protein